MTTCRKIAASIFAVLISIAATAQELEIDEMSGLITSQNTKQLGAVRQSRIKQHFERLRQKFFTASL